MRILFGASVLLFVSLSLPARADIAPTPGPAEARARMAAEAVEIVVDKDVARVTARFTLDFDDVKPLQYCRALPEGGEECGNEYYQFLLAWPVLESQLGTFDDFSVLVDGAPASVWSQELREEPRFDPPITKWLDIQTPRMTKRPGRVQVVVTYTETLKASFGRAMFTYVLRSGALWKGTIGAATVTIQAGEDVTFEDPGPAPAEATPTRLSWVFSDFEPAADITLTVRVPLTPREEELKRSFQENIRRNEELDAQSEEIRKKEAELDARYREYLEALEKAKEAPESPAPEAPPGDGTGR